jgi:uncharacterized damage-inducible protein DinB
METMQQIAKHFRDFYSGGNWTASNLKKNLQGITWKEATTKVHDLNTIAALVYHMNYYVRAMLNVFRGTPMNASDKYSFDLPPVNSQEDWEKLVQQSFDDATALAEFIENLPPGKMTETFVDPKYGNYLRNIMGVIEHNHYHLGQIALIKKIVRSEISTSSGTAVSNN